jgi:hypothetical protein
MERRPGSKGSPVSSLHFSQITLADHGVLGRSSDVTGEVGLVFGRSRNARDELRHIVIMAE